MTRLTFLFAAACLCLLGACSPTFNWRDARPEGTALAALLPCKPDQATRSVPLGGQTTELVMLGCDAGGATFAIAVATVADPSRMASVLAGWQAATQANMKGSGAAPAAPLKIPGAALQPAPELQALTGQRADGRVVQSRAAYFAHGRQVFQAVIYADKIAPEVSETFFSSLRFEAEPVPGR